MYFTVKERSILSSGFHAAYLQPYFRAVLNLAPAAAQIMGEGCTRSHMICSNVCVFRCLQHVATVEMMHSAWSVIINVSRDRTSRLLKMQACAGLSIRGKRCYAGAEGEPATWRC